MFFSQKAILKKELSPTATAVAPGDFFVSYMLILISKQTIQQWLLNHGIS